MGTLEHLLDNNQKWSKNVTLEDPIFFDKLADQQSPEYMWIGCSDSRVPANNIVKLLPGDMFVHRNIANLVVHTDLNCLSVIQYAVDVLKVKHIIVCGHYSCGGVKTVFEDRQFGLIDNWLRHIQDVKVKHETFLSNIDDPVVKVNKLCELNVIEQVVNVSRTTIVQQAWQKNQDLTVHGWIYGLHNGLLKDLKVSMTNSEEVPVLYDNAIHRLELSVTSPIK